MPLQSQELLLSILAQDNFTLSSIKETVYLNVTRETFNKLIQFEFIDIDDPLGGISVEEIRDFLQSNPSFLVRLSLMKDLDDIMFVEVIGITSGYKMPELHEICAFVELFRHQDEFVLTTERCFCILD